MATTETPAAVARAPLAFETEDDDALWASVCDLIRADGDDPDDMLRRAARNMHVWACVPKALQARHWHRSFHEFAYEREDEMGNVTLPTEMPPPTHAPMAVLGERVDDPFAEAVYVRDLLEYEGPLVSEFRTAHGAPLLYWWSDMDSTAHRWLVVELAVAQMDALKNCTLPVRDAITGAVGGVVHVQDRDDDVVLATYRLAVADVPEDLLPQAGVTLPKEE